MAHGRIAVCQSLFLREPLGNQVAAADIGCAVDEYGYQGQTDKIGCDGVCISIENIRGAGKYQADGGKHSSADLSTDSADDKVSDNADKAGPHSQFQKLRVKRILISKS